MNETIKKQGLNYITLNGSPYEMGLKHGETFRDEIREIKAVIKEYLSRVRRFIPGGFILSLMKFFSGRYIRYIPEEYLTEMRGVAQGAGVELRFILLINVFDDLAASLACSAFAVLEDKAKDANAILARNLDYPVFTELMCRINTVFMYHPSSGLPFISVAWPGYIGIVTGMNSRGICLASLSASTVEKSNRGVPAGLLYRKSLQYSQDINTFSDTITSARRTRGNIVLAASSENGGKALVLELSSRSWKIREPEDGILTSTNHYKTEDMKKIGKDFKRPPAIDIPDSFFTIEYSCLRDDLMKNGCLNGGIDPQRAAEILKIQEVANPGTVQSVVFVPERREALIAQKLKTPVSTGSYKKFSIS